MNMHGISPASPISEPLLTAKSPGVKFSTNDNNVNGGIIDNFNYNYQGSNNNKINDQNDDVMIRSILSRPLVSLLPPTPLSSTSIKLTWKVSYY